MTVDFSLHVKRLNIKKVRTMEFIKSDLNITVEELLNATFV